MHSCLMLSCLTLCLLLSACGGTRSASSGGTDVSEAMDTLRVHITTTGEACTEAATALSALTSKDEENADLMERYHALAKSVADLTKQTERMTKLTGEVEKRHDAYVAEWEASLDSFQNETYRERSASRLKEVKTMVTSTMTSVEPVLETLPPLVSELDDTLVFLGTDLTQSGVDALSPELKRLRIRLQKIEGLSNPAIESLSTTSGKLTPISQP